MKNKDKRLIEDYLPIQAVSAEASREKGLRKGNVSTIHIWWARRPLPGCRAAVYGALVPIISFAPSNGLPEKKEEIARAAAAQFVKRLCTTPPVSTLVDEANCHVLTAHAERLSTETGRKITPEDILAGRAPRPKVLDLFAGGGAIPLEALRLGCDVQALELNPLAHVVELCTLVYPQKYGKPVSDAVGAGRGGTWAGLAEEVRHWGEWVLDRLALEIADLYPAIPAPSQDRKHQETTATLWPAESPRRRAGEVGS